MSKINEMIKELCPNGVERMKLGEVCNILDNQRKPISKGNRIAGIYPYYGANGIQDFVNNYIFDGTYILFGEDGSVINPDNSPVLNWAKGKLWVNNHAHVLAEKKECALLRYLFYILKTIDVSDIVRGVPPKINQANLRDIEIPLPPLPIQREIVNILDKFSSLIDNLDETIKLRQKQYEYYREKLLTFKDGECEWKTLGEIGTIIRGNGLQKTDFSKEGVGCVHYGQIYTQFGFSINKTLTFVPEELSEKLTKVEPGNLIIACTSENVEDVCKSVVWLGSETIVTGGHACVFKHNENPKYIGYCFLTNNFFNQKQKYAYGAKVIDIKTEKLSLIKIPVPERFRQDEIVSSLDNFESLISNLKLERDLRQKQYEYYREKLLTFE